MPDVNCPDPKIVAAFLRAAGHSVSDEVVTAAFLVPASPKAADALKYAEEDWKCRAGENDRRAGSVIDNMFKMSGWSASGVPKGGHDKIPEWCGMAVCSWLLRAGMDSDFNTSFLHCLNVESFFTYGAQKNVNPSRLDTELQLEGRWAKIKDWHQENKASRDWFSSGAIAKLIAAGNTANLFKPGDVTLLDWSGRATEADHITMVRSFDGTVLRTFEGNRTGQGPVGELRSDAVVACEYDLSVPAKRGLIYGIGRLSPLDFTQHSFR